MADGLSGSGGVYTGPGDSPRPRGGVTRGDGWQVSAGPSKSWDVNNGVVWLWEHLF